jgi:hypothetical protein
MQLDKEAQLRPYASYFWHRFLTGGRSIKIVSISRRLRMARRGDPLRQHGYGVATLSADSIVEGWKKAGWIEVSPDRTEIRLKPDGEEQLARWLEEDRLWRSGETGELELPKRLKAGECATNLRRICQVVGHRTIECIHDPYTDEQALLNLLKLGELGASISPRLCLLRRPASGMERQTLASFLRDINTEKSSQWEVRSDASPAKPHRRFLICTDGSIITCGMSLNKLDKDEVLDDIPASDNRADHDRKLFQDKWKLGIVVR